MKKVLLSCMAVAAMSATAMAQALPEYPEKLDFTLNGEKELPGVTVTQDVYAYDGDNYLTYNITGESDAKEITIDLITPEGWDGFVVYSDYEGGGSDINPLKAKAKAPAKEGEDYWMDLMYASYMGATQGNSITLPVDGEEWEASAFLVKDDRIYMIQIDFVFEVKYTGVNEDPEDPEDPENPEVPEYPSSLNFTLNGEKELPGVSVSQTLVPYDGTEYIKIVISGETEASEITMDFETPEGWDYALIGSIIGGSSSPWKTRSGDSDHWSTLSEVIAQGYKKGNSFEFPVNGKDSYGTIYLVKGDKVWEYSIDIEFNVSKAEGSGDDPIVEAPAFPDHLDYTLNGEKELPGITVRQLLDETTQMIDIQGKCNSDKFTVTFETPEGWDGLMIADFWETGEITTLKTRALNNLIPISNIEGMGFKKGNTITYPVDGEANIGYIALIKGDMACQTFIDYSITVGKSEGGEEPGEDPVFPESFKVNLFNDGLEVTQGMNWGVYDIIVTGEVAANTFPIVIDVPEGWDGFVCFNHSHEGDVTITENNQGPKATRSEEMEWIPVEELLAKGCVKGNRFTFEPTFNPEYNNDQTVEIRLYKGDMAMKEYFNLTVAVTKGEMAAPEFPAEFDVTATGNDVDVWQGAYADLPEGTLSENENELVVEWFNCEYAIKVSGKTADDNTTVEFNLPEGWAGVQPIKITVPDFNDYEYLRTRANESDWQMLDEMKETFGSMFGYFDTSIEGGTKFDFAAGEKQIYLCYLYTEMVDADEAVKLADSANPFLLIVNVEKDGEVSELTFPDKFDVSLSCEGLTVSQELEVYHGESQFIITIEGECSESELTVTLAVPEGWDGYYGMSDYDYSNDIEPLNTRSEVNEYLWLPAEAFEGYYGYKKCDSLTFKVDGEEHGGYMFLYKGDQVYYCAIMIEDLVMPTTVGVDSVESTAPARYYNLQGAEVANPEPGIYVKVINGKSYKVVVK